MIVTPPPSSPPPPPPPPPSSPPPSPPPPPPPTTTTPRSVPREVSIVMAYTAVPASWCRISVVMTVVLPLSPHPDWCLCVGHSLALSSSNGPSVSIMSRRLLTYKGKNYFKKFVFIFLWKKKCLFFIFLFTYWSDTVSHCARNTTAENSDQTPEEIDHFILYDFISILGNLTCLFCTWRNRSALRVLLCSRYFSRIVWYGNTQAA